jgi:hypothetical protein
MKAVAVFTHHVDIIPLQTVLMLLWRATALLEPQKNSDHHSEATAISV